MANAPRQAGAIVIAGHFGFAAMVKSREPQVPLWSLMLACQWMDVLFVPLFALGIERIVAVDPAAGPHPGYGEAVIYADYTHSLLGALVIAATFGLVATWRWGRRNGIVLAAVVFSHWVLDLLVHRADMPILPGNLEDLPRLGLGLWRLPAAAVLVEFALVVLGSYLYWRAAAKALRGAGERETKRATRLAALMLVSGFVTLGLNLFGM
ncbi:MAG: permease [Polyangiaceae bacterium]